MPNIKLILQYDGTNFSGLELQPDMRTIRGEIEKALFRLYKEKIKIISTSRTDSGVHAFENVVNFKIKSSPIPVLKITKALNSLLPKDLRVIKAKKVKEDYNCRYAAKKKTYEYLVYNGDVMPPVLLNLAWQVKPGLDISAMKKAAKYLVGKHDFSSFCAAGGDDSNFVRTLYSVSVKKKLVRIWDGSKLEVVSCKFSGNGFLYKMVRLMVGSLVEAGLHKKSRRCCAPSHGLCLLKVVF